MYPAGCRCKVMRRAGGEDRRDFPIRAASVQIAPPNVQNRVADMTLDLHFSNVRIRKANTIERMVKKMKISDTTCCN